MKLLSIQLHNFRQFYGTTPEINLASGEKNTTVIHGNNGAGKTTLLNAFTWVLYESFTGAFAAPELLINKRAINEADYKTNVECYVKLEFEHDHKRYQLRRRFFVYRDIDNHLQVGKTDVFMLLAGDDGKWFYPSEQPEDIVNRILPKTLHQYFFFDGEHIDHISRSQQKNTLAEDTKELIGIKLLNRTIEHLKKAQKTLAEELKTIGTTEIKELLRQQLKLEEEKEIIQKKQLTIREELEKQETLKQSLNSQLLAISGLQETQNLKIKLEADCQRLRNNLVTSQKKIKGIISQQAWLIFTEGLSLKFQDLLEKLREKGAIPSGIKQEFIEQLLAAQRCICGEELLANTERYQQVKAWLDKAGIAQIETKVIRLESQLHNLTELRSKFWQNLDQEIENINNWRQQLSQIENQLDELKNKLRNYPQADIQNLQKQLDSAENNLKNCNFDLGANQQRLNLIEQQISELNRQIEKAKIKENKQEQAKKRIEATQIAINTLTEVQNLLERRFRVSLEARIQEIFSLISFTPYLPRLNEKYELSLVENTTKIAKIVPASTGENQILSLSFIGAIIDTVREWSQNNSLMGPDTSTFPIVMDSPFGSLDEQYRRQVAKAIPQLANQLLILVTKTQWRGEVALEIKPYLGKVYVLVYHSPKNDCEEDSIEINGQVYPLVRQSYNQYEYTEIIEVNCSTFADN